MYSAICVSYVDSESNEIVLVRQFANEKKIVNLITVSLKKEEKLLYLFIKSDVLNVDMYGEIWNLQYAKLIKIKVFLQSSQSIHQADKVVTHVYLH